MIYIKRSAILCFLSEIGVGGDELSLRFIVLLLNPSVPVLIYSGMSENVQSFKRKREREREREDKRKRKRE